MNALPPCLWMNAARNHLPETFEHLDTPTSNDLPFAFHQPKIAAARASNTFRDWEHTSRASSSIGRYLPSAEAHLAILAASHGIELALDDATGQVVGFINVISDGILSAYIPLLEVRPEYQGRGIGGTLIDRIVERYGTLYMLDLCCDKNVVPLYAAKGFIRVEGMVHRCWDPAPGSDYRPDDRTATRRRP